jgi:hypothetical protein
MLAHCPAELTEVQRLADMAVRPHLMALDQAIPESLKPSRITTDGSCESLVSQTPAGDETRPSPCSPQMETPPPAPQGMLEKASVAP